VFRETVSHLKDLPRYRQILATLVKYGYQDVVSALHIEGIVRPFERSRWGMTFLLTTVRGGFGWSARTSDRRSSSSARC